ncbi:MAG: hypothetical protein IKN55_10095 [Oscillospiraceae bacterium]|nr:hypothetical protein [Oscillospiraceae bacterium]
MPEKWFPELKRKGLLTYGIVIAGLLGLALILLSSFRPERQETPEPAPDAAQAAYQETLEAQLTEMLGAMAGVGRVKVLVTLGGSEEYCYAQAGERTVSGDQVRSSNTYVTVGGASREPLLESVSHPVITGVVVACEGGGGNSVREAVYHAVGVACGLPSSQIFVTELG